MTRPNRVRSARFLRTLVVLAMVSAACSGSVTVKESEAEPETTPAPSSSPLEQPTPAPPEPVAPSPLPEPTPFAETDDLALPVDPDVRIGTLDNGLTYYIRPNTAPGGRAELRLAVNAGSAIEDADQSAVAHFLEHMLFNGTEQYPSNQLIAVLESFGSEFGPDVNAYTSYDETVYELSIPTDDAELLGTAVDVLREWAGNATIDPDEVAAEIGVVLEEWRLRDQGIGGRIGELYDELLATGTAYEGRSPIGEVDAIRSMSADVLRRFYDDWYRPDLMSVIAVGDFDPNTVEELIKEAFDGLGSPTDPRPRPEVTVEPNTAFEYRRLEDPELPSSYVEIIYAGPDQPARTEGDYRRSLAYRLATTIVGTRFSDDVSRGDAPFLTAYSSTTPLARDIATPGLLAEAPAADLAASFEALLVEAERIRRAGFSQAEVDRAVSSFEAGLDQAYAGRDTTQDTSYADEYVANFLSGEPMLGWDDLLRIEGGQLGDMTPEYVTGVFLETLGASTPEIVVVGPAADAALLPSESTLLDILDRVPGSDVAPRTDDSQAIESLMEAPPPADVIGTAENQQLESRRISFANGVTVLLKTTTVAENQLALQGVSPGGASVFAEADLAAVFAAADVVTGSGVGPADQVELDRLLADQFVSVSFGQDETNEFVFGNSSTDDLETLLQLVFQYFTAPRVELSALDSFVSELEPFAADPGQIPSVASSIELLSARYGDGRRFQVLPTIDELAALTSEEIKGAFTDMYGDAGDFTFTIVGDFDPETASLLAARYLGNLPGDSTADEWVDHQPPPPAGIVERTVRAGQDPQGQTTVLITSEVASSQVRDIQLQILQNILSTRLRDQLREALGATYSPAASIGAIEEPDELIETYVEVSGDPDRLGEIVDEIEGVLVDLRSGGLTDAEVATAREQVRLDLELVSNSFWSAQMLYADDHPSVTMLTIDQRVSAAANTTNSDIQSLIELVLPADQYIVVNLVPAG